MCKKCHSLSINPYGLGHECKRCPSKLTANKNRTKCSLYNGYEFYDTIFIYTKMFENSFEHDTFLGPIGEKSQIYYISPFNQNKLEDAIYEFEDTTPYEECYIFMLIKHDTLNESVIKQSRRKYCAASTLSSIEFVNLSQPSIHISYTSNMKCMSNISKVYTTDLSIDCSVTDDEHSIPRQLNSNDQCSLKFKWKVPFACRICTATDVTNSMGQCNDYARTVTHNVKNNSRCIIPKEFINDTILKIDIDNVSATTLFNSSQKDSYIFTTETTEHCKSYEISSVFLNALIIFGVICAILLIISVWCANDYKQKYKSLSQEATKQEDSAIEIAEKEETKTN